MDDDTIIRQRIAGRSVRAIAKAQHCSVAQVNEAIDRWAESAITDKIRKHTSPWSSPASMSFSSLLRARARRRCFMRRSGYQEPRAPLRHAWSAHAANCGLTGRRRSEAERRRRLIGSSASSPSFVLTKEDPTTH
jgi:hypothetical protein